MALAVMNLLDGPALRWELWSTRAELLLADASDTDLVEARALLEPMLHQVEMAASRFRPDSDIARLAKAGGASVLVTPMMIDLVHTALRAAAVSDGLVDPTLGGALINLGYDRTITSVKAMPVRAVSSAHWVVGGWRDVVVDADASTVTIPAGMVLDLGATAKARAADLGADIVWQATGLPVLFGLGGDVAVAGSPVDSDGWTVTVAETTAQLSDDTATTSRIAVHDGGLATSTTQARRWMTTGGGVHHVLDPRTMAPAREVWRTVSVAAATCVDANIASTTALILGDGATEWLLQHQLPSRLVSGRGEVTHVAGWPVDNS